MESAFATADHVFEDTFKFPMVFHYALEPHCVVADFDGQGFTLWSCAQSPGAVQKVLEAFMSPGSVTERVHFYVGEYFDEDKQHEGGGRHQRCRGLDLKMPRRHLWPAERDVFIERVPERDRNWGTGPVQGQNRR